MGEQRTRYARSSAENRWVLGNQLFELEVSAPSGAPVISRLVQAAQPEVNWAAADGLEPVVAVRAEDDHVRLELRFVGAQIDSCPHRGAQVDTLRLDYDAGGTRVQHYLMPAEDLPAWRSWTTVTRTATGPLAGLVRFDALNLPLTTGEAEPEVAYLVGWLFGPRTDAPATGTP